MNKPTSPERRTALCYHRKSMVVKGGAGPAGPELQMRDTHARAAELRMTPEDYCDIEGHNSGLSDTRRDWQRLKQRMHDPDVGAIIVYSWEFAARSVKLLLQLVDEADAHGLRFISTSDSIDTRTADGRLQLTIIVAASEHYARRTSEKRRASIDWLRRERGRHYGRAPFGTRREEINGERVLVPDRRPQANGTDHDALVHLYELYTLERLGFRRAAIRMNAEGWRYRSHIARLGKGALREWTQDDVRRCLMSHWVYSGMVTVGRAYRDKIELIKGSHAPIIPEVLTTAAAARLEALGPLRGRTRHQPQAYPISGLLHCQCGARLRGGSPDGRRRYLHPVDCPLGMATHQAAPLEEEVRQRLMKLKPPASFSKRNNARVLQILAAEQTGQHPDSDRLAVEAALTRLKELYVAGDIPRSVYDTDRAFWLSKLPVEEVLDESFDLRAEVAKGFDVLLNDCTPGVLRDFANALYKRIVVVGRGEPLVFEAHDWCKAWA